MTLPAGALCTVQQVKDALGIASATATYDTRLENLCGRVGLEVNRYCDRTFIYSGTDAIEYHDFRFPSTLLYVRNVPIVSVTSVYEDSSHDYSSGSLLVVNTDYRVSTGMDGLILREGTTWALGTRSIKITYKGGYTNQAAVPLDLALAAAEIAAFYWKMTKDGDSRLGVASKSMADGSVSGFLQSIPPYLRGALYPYRRVAA